MFTAAGQRHFLAELADENIDDLQFRLIHAAIEMIQEHFLGQRRALAERKQLQHRIFLPGQLHAIAIHFDSLCVEVDGKLARPRSEEHTSELQSLMRISYAVFLLKTNTKLLS